jgi:hypothetical protein
VALQDRLERLWPVVQAARVAVVEPVVALNMSIMRHTTRASRVTTVRRVGPVTMDGLLFWCRVAPRVARAVPVLPVRLDPQARPVRPEHPVPPAHMAVAR